MSDLLPPTPNPTSNGANIASTTAPDPTTVAAAAAAAATSKRQRRPSVRLGDIGEQPAASDPFLRRHKPFTKPNETLTLASSIQKHRNPNPKFPKRGRKVRSTSWTSSKLEGEEEEDEGFRSEFDDLRREDSLSPSDKDRVRVDPPSDAEVRDWNEENPENGGIGLDEDGGVRTWLNRLGLGRYAPVFEIHEVDDEVLPMLTMEDLKDMGINAVGSRRKMFCAIQKLKKNHT